MNTLRNKTDRPHTTYGSTRLALAVIAGALLMTPDATQAQVKGSALPVAETLTLADRVMMVTDPSGTPSTKTATLTLIKSTLAAGSGDVVGPASSGNNRVAFFDGTTGKLLKDSGLTLSGTNTGDQDLSGYLTSATAASTYQPLDSDLTAIAALTTTSTGRSLLAAADAAALRTILAVSDIGVHTFGSQRQILTSPSSSGTQATSSSISNVLDFLTGSGLTAGQGSVIYRGATGWALLSAGTNGQVFTTGGAGANPSWTTVGVSDGDKGSITVSSSGTVWTIDSSAVTDSMLAGSISPSKVTGTAAILGANTFTDTQTVPSLSYSGNISATGSGYVQTRNFFQALDASGAANRVLIGESFSGIRLSVTLGVGFSAGGAEQSADFTLSRVAAGVLGLSPAAFEFQEMTAPSGSADKARIYSEDNGSGKTRLMVIFGSGAAQQIAIEP